MDTPATRNCAWAIVCLVFLGYLACGIVRVSLELIPNFLPPPPIPLPASMSIGFQADRSAVGRNEAVGVTVVARNDSSVAVKNLLIELVQETKYWARGSQDCSTRTLTSVEVPITELAQVEVGDNRGRSQSSSAIAGAARADLEQQLAVGAGAKREILVPGDTTITFRSETIEVRHLLTVRLETPSCVDSPDAWMPLRIQPGTQPGTSSTVPEVKPSHFAPSSAEAATLVNVDPVVVPQNALRLEYSYELPENSGPARKQW